MQPIACVTGKKWRWYRTGTVVGKDKPHGKGPAEEAADAGPDWGVFIWWSRQRCEMAPSTHTEEITKLPVNTTDRPCHGWGGYSPKPHSWGPGSTQASSGEIYWRRSDNWNKSSSEYFVFPLPVSFHQCSIFVDSFITSTIQSYGAVQQHT
jgi:hypothetical protein